MTLAAIALDSLACLPQPLRRDQLIFPGRDGGLFDTNSWRRKTWRKALAAAGVDYREPYAMRDTFATLCLADGAPLEWISRQMGHTDIDTTRRHYARWLPETDYRIVDALNAARAQAGHKTDTQLGIAK